MPKNYQATMAAIRTAYGHRLTSADLCELVNLHSLAEVVAYLKETETYGEILKGLEPAYTHRGHLEMLLKRNLFSQCLHFCSMEHLQKSPFFRFFIYDYEIRELMNKIRFRPDDIQSYISSMDTWAASYLNYSQEALAHATSYEEIIAAVAQTPYAAVLKKQLQYGELHTQYTQCELALRACCLERILNEAKKQMKGDDLAELKKLIGEQVDLINLINAYRLKHVFHAERNELKSMMLPIPGRLPQRICEELYTAQDTDAFFEILDTTRYGKRMRELDMPDAPESVRLEHSFQVLRQHSARKALHFSGHAAVSLYAVHVLYQIEVQNLITIIEGKRYDMPVSVIQSMLIMD
ncbi:MAG: V-type ATPase subunit [Oscillospiraceae bacterium]|nr:V-type ATPase subunit [Oscillospiraceae bacterium]